MSWQDDDALRAQLLRVERKLDYLLKHYGADDDTIARIGEGHDPAKLAQAALEREVLAINAAHGKIAAIKHLREQTQMGLKDAKTTVEAMIASASAAPVTIPEPVEPPELDEIRHMISRGQKIKAIKLYREVYQTDLRTAKEAVDGMEARREW